MLLSLLFLHCVNRFIPHNPDRSMPRIGMPLFYASSSKYGLIGIFSGCDLRMSSLEVAMIQYVSAMFGQ